MRTGFHYLTRLLFSSARFPGGVHHLREAITLNHSRLPLYARLTQGRSLPLSKRLIFAERMLLPGTWLMDFLSRPYHEQGIRIGELEYVSMANMPPFQESYPFEIEPLEQFSPVDSRALHSRLLQALQEGGVDAVFREAENELFRLVSPRAYHAMVRHVLESIARAAWLARLHAERAESAGIWSPAWLSRLFLRSQFLLLGFAAKIDQDLAPIQAAGIPILIQDVPEIPIRVNAYDT
jgi:hypothetical protein